MSVLCQECEERDRKDKMAGKKEGIKMDWWRGEGTYVGSSNSCASAKENFLAES